MDKHVHYNCKSCNYKFKRPIGSQAPLRCPYCGSAGVEKYRPTLAEDLLKSVEGM